MAEQAVYVNNVGHASLLGCLLAELDRGKVSLDDPIVFVVGDVMPRVSIDEELEMVKTHFSETQFRCELTAPQSRADVSKT